MTLLLVGLGGALGASLRFLALLLAPAPWGTLAVNVAGSFAIGVLAVLLAARAAWAPFLVTGVLGGFTTFSAFSLDTLRLFEAGRSAQAAVYVALSVAASLLACAAGLWLGRWA